MLKRQKISPEVAISIKRKKWLSTKAVSIWTMFSLDGHIVFDRTLASLKQNVSCMLVFSNNIFPAYVTVNYKKKYRPQVKDFLYK